MIKKRFVGTLVHSKYDTNWDGAVNQEELDNAQEMLELELREEKADAHRRMAWVAMASIIFFTIALFLPVVSEGRVAALADLLGLFYIAQAGVVGAYMGITAWMSRGQSTVINRVPASPASKSSASEPVL